jgi:transcription termination/antitermination protein NusG
MSVLQVQESESEKTLYRAAHGHSDGDRMTEQDLNHNWFAVCTRHQHEKSAARILEYKEFEVFLPLYKARHRWKDRIKEVSLPLFPGYLFVREGFKRWLAILTTPGVSSIVSCGGQPAAIPFSEIEGVKRVVESALRVEPHPFLKSGDWVRVKHGPIAGVEGILLRQKNVARLVLSVEMLGKSAAVEVDATDVERIHARALRTDFNLRTSAISVPTSRWPSLSTA